MKEITVESVLETLVNYGYVDKELIPEIEKAYASEKARLFRKRWDEGLGEPSVAQVLGNIGIPLTTGIGELLSEDLVTELIARQLGLKYEKIDPLKIDSDVVQMVSRPFCRKHGILPIRRKGENLEVAVFNPLVKEPYETIKRLTGLKAAPVVASLSDIEKTINEVMGFKKSVEKAAKQIEAGVDIGNLEQLIKLSDLKDLESDDRHVVAAVEYLLHYSLSERVTDIHIEPLREESRIRVRIDGILHTIFSAPKPVHQAMVNRIKALSRLDIAERRRPQDGRLKTTAPDEREVEMRVSTISTAFGEKIVIRIFEAGELIQDIEKLGFFPEQFEIYKRLVRSQTGIILITGPTGSGKTTTLYSTLKHIHSPTINIVTIEDPIEMVLEEFNQVAVQRKIGMDFATSLKHILRQDPDVIMVGEIRDAETAENAVAAAMTGHLVFATLHANDSVSAAIRLEELGLKRYLIASTLRGVVAQRLVRRICPNCKIERQLDEKSMRALDIVPPEGRKTLTVYEGEGCNVCRGTGYYKRMGVFEVLDVTDRLARMIKQGSDARELWSASLQEGLTPLRDNGIRLLATGITTYDELLRSLV